MSVSWPVEEHVSHDTEPACWDGLREWTPGDWREAAFWLLVALALAGVAAVVLAVGRVG